MIEDSLLELQESELEVNDKTRPATEPAAQGFQGQHRTTPGPHPTLTVVDL